MGLGGKPAVAEKEMVLLLVDLLFHPCDGLFILP